MLPAITAKILQLMFVTKHQDHTSKRESHDTSISKHTGRYQTELVILQHMVMI